MDSYILGELLYHPTDDTLKEGQHGHSAANCTLDHDYMSFMNSETFSQLVISESALACLVNQVARSPIGQLHLNTMSMREMFSMSDFHFNTTSIASQIPVFEEKIGANETLLLGLHIKDATVLVG